MGVIIKALNNPLVIRKKDSNKKSSIDKRLYQ